VETWFPGSPRRGDWAAVTAGAGGRRLAETAGKLTGSVTGINTSTILTELE